MQTLLILHSLTSEKLSEKLSLTSGKQMRANVGEDAEVRTSYTLLIEI